MGRASGPGGGLDLDLRLDGGCAVLETPGFVPRARMMKTSVLDHPLRAPWALLALCVLVALPFVAEALDEGFYITVASRILIFALAATSLNLVLGFGGMVSFGHAAFMGIGAYAVGILMDAGLTSAAVSWPVAVLAAAVFAAIMGAISLRTQGVYFIMITLAFAQMLYYFMVSLKAYGGDDGLSLASRSSWAGWDITGDTGFYYLVLGVFVWVFLGLHRLINSRLGHALQAIRDNETRMAALGFSVFRIKLLAFVVAGAIGGLSGALLANQNGFVSPSLMQWSQSGMLMIMVILGGVGRLYGGLVGAVVFLLLEEVLVAYTIHWTLALGALLLAVVLVAPNGLLSLWTRREHS
jgi:branched-chain amino acid transport system permease protein